MEFQSKLILGITRETIDWDFKKEIGEMQLEDLAIDIAAFANQYGGCILVGIKEQLVDGSLVASSLHHIKDPESVHKKVQHAKTRFLPPELIVRCHTIEIDGSNVVSIVVSPMRSICYFKKEDTYRFPIRGDYGNGYLTYDKVESMYQDAGRKSYLKFLELVGRGQLDVELSPCIKKANGSTFHDLNISVRMIDGSSELFELTLNTNQIHVPYSLVDEVWNISTVGVKIHLRLKTSITMLNVAGQAASKFVFE
ncbi:MAG: ATP-binding protein [Fibrobacteres bacterium]|nr:ATP-binding protein [Fibrobacterota bacterium]